MWGNTYSPSHIKAKSLRPPGDSGPHETVWAEDISAPTENCCDGPGVHSCNSEKIRIEGKSVVSATNVNFPISGY